MVVDDHPMWRDAVERDLQAAGFDVVGVAADGHQAIARFPAARPDVVVLDLQIPGPNGVEVTQEVLAQGPVRPGADPVGLRRARRRARGGEGRRDRLPRQVRLAGGADRRGPPGGARRHGVHPGPGGAGARGVPPDGRRPAAGRPDAPQLTERETEILKMVAKGMEYKAIAERLVISHRTVQNHVQNTLRKLQMHNRVELTRWAIERGLDDDDGRGTPWTTPWRRTCAGSGTTPTPPATLETLVARAPRPPRLGALREPRHHARQTDVGGARRRRRPAGRRRPRGLLLPPERRARGAVAGLGFDVVRRHGHVYTMPEMRFDTLLNHLVLVVRGLPTHEHPEGAWWPDVGLGEGFRDPAPLVVGPLADPGLDLGITAVEAGAGMVVPQRPARQLHRPRGARPAARRGRLPSQALDRARLALHPDPRRAAPPRRGRRHGARLRADPAGRRRRRDHRPDDVRRLACRSRRGHPAAGARRRRRRPARALRADARRPPTWVEAGRP